MNEPTVKLRWRNRVEKYANEQKRLQGEPEDVIEWETEDIVPLSQALAMGFTSTERDLEGEPKCH